MSQASFVNTEQDELHTQVQVATGHLCAGAHCADKATGVCVAVTAEPKLELWLFDSRALCTCAP